MTTPSTGLSSWNFSAQEYGDQWRRGRRLFHSGVHIGVAPKYQRLQIRSARAFLKQLREKSDDLHASVRKFVLTSSLDNFGLRLNCLFRHVGSTIIDVVYGIDSENNNYFINIADEAVRLFSLAVTPGAFMVDLIPARKYRDHIFHAIEFGLTYA